MIVAREQPVRAARRRVTTLAAFALVVMALLTGFSGAAGAVGRGIVDNRLETNAKVDLAQVPTLARELGPDRLRAGWTRVLVHWARLQPHQPGVSYTDDADGDGYVDSYVGELDAIIGELAANRVKVILTFADVPKWASNRILWRDPPRGCSRGYSPFYAMDVSDPPVLAQFEGLAAFLAGRYAGSADYLECWNEPNTGGSFYPQSRPGARFFGARTYATMLRAFHDGVKRANPSAVVIAGGTAPRGADDAFSTSPRTFATYVRDRVAGRYFEAYSHHPYQQGDRSNAPPHLPPPDPRMTVSLGNLGVLLQLFPKKDFYLTEFGYNTEKPALFGMTVSEAKQAHYLRDAYAFAARRYPRVKTILWFMVGDLAPSPDRCGASMGLSTVDGVRKPGWFAFAGGNRLSLNAPAATRRSAAFSVSGVLASRVFGALRGKQITLQTRRPGQARWQTISARLTRGDGSYAIRVTPTSTRLYRVVWDGVCESPKALVRIR